MLKPSFDRIVVLRDTPPQDEKVGLIIRPDTVQPRPMTGTVLAVGDGATELKVGDRIRFERFAGYDVEVDGQEVVIMRETEVIGVLYE